MATITTRAGKGSALTHAELDANFSNLNAELDGNVTVVVSLEINCSLGNYFTKTINADSTFTVSNVPTGQAYIFVLELTHTSGVVTWFANLEWPDGAAPSLTTGKTHLFVFVTDDGGTRWRGVAHTGYTT